MLYVANGMHSTMFADKAVATKQEITREQAIALVKENENNFKVFTSPLFKLGIEMGLEMSIGNELMIHDIDLEAGDYLLVITFPVTADEEFIFDCWAIS